MTLKLSGFFKTIHEALGLTPDEVKRIEAALPDSPLKRYVEYEIEKTQFNLTMGNAAKTIEDLNFERGVREGLTIAKGILNRRTK